MTRATIIIRNESDRRKVATWAANVEPGTRVEFKKKRRSSSQNALMWSLLGEVSQQVDWHGVRLSPDDWKLVFLAALQTETRIVPNLDGTGFVNLSRSSDLSKAEFSDLIELILKFGAEHGVVFHDDKVEAA